MGLLASILGLFGGASGERLGNWFTSGPDEDEHPPAPITKLIAANSGTATVYPVWAPGGRWASGWWDAAQRTPAHPDRVGPSIIPWALVVHTTDTYPGGFGAIVKSWTTTRGQGNAATFMIGRTQKDGVVQFCPITKNANHAGGHVHGNWRLPGSPALIHPNLVSVGVELDNAGRLVKDRSGAAVHPDTRKPIPLEDVFWDPSGHPWHAVTPYQMDQLQRLWLDLRCALHQPPPGVLVVPDGSYIENGVPWAGAWRPELVGHVTLDPINKTDPGPQVLQILRGWS